LSDWIKSFQTVPGLLLREADRFVLNRVLSDKKSKGDRKAKLRDPRPLHYKPLPRGYLRVKHLFYLVSIAETNHAGCPIYRMPDASFALFSGGACCCVRLTSNQKVPLRQTAPHPQPF